MEQKLRRIKCLLIIIFINCINNNVYSQVAKLDISGNFTVYGSSSVWWDYQYKPTGSSTYTQSPIQYSNSSSTIRLNPFISWDFKIRYYNYYGQPGTWGTDSTVNADYSLISKSVGYKFNFDNPFLNEGWRGYRTNNITYESDNFLIESTYLKMGTSGKSIEMYWNYSKPMMMVSPKITDLSADKKFSINAYSFQGSYSIILGTISDPYNPATFHPLKTVTLPYGSDFSKIDVFLNNYNGSDQYIAIKSNGSNGTVFFDDFSYEQSVNCFDLTNVAISNISEHKATISYTSNTAIEYEISLKNLRTGATKIYTTNNIGSFEVTDLVGATNYEIKIRGNCDVGLYTNWSPIISFSTPCDQITSNYFTSFEENNNYQLNPCWSKLMNETSLYIMDGTTVIPAKTGSKLINISASYSQTQKGYLITPYITDLSNSKRIKFYLTAGNSDYIERGITIGTMSNPSDETTFRPIKTINPEEINQINGYKTNGYLKEHIIYLDNYDNSLDHHYIAFKIENSTTYDSDNLYIDDFTYETSPNCREVVNLKTLTTTYDTAKVSWSVEDNQPQDFEIEYGIKGFKIGEGTRKQVQGLPFVINSNLNSDTEYDFYVRTKCDNGYSNWSDRGYFKTKCIGFNAPFYNGFEDGDFKTGTCWSRHTIDIKESFFSPNSFVNIYKNNAHPTLPYKGSYAGYVTNRHYGKDLLAPAKNILITPRLIDLDNTKIIKFWGIQPYSVGTIEIGTLSNPEDYTTFKLFESITPNSSTYNKWTEYTIDFSNYYGTDKFVGIRIKTNDNVEGFLYVDDFNYENNPCIRPTNLTAVQKNEDSVELNWNINNTNPVNCEIEYGYIGFTPGNGTSLNVTSLPVLISGLSSNSEYEFRVRNICNNPANWSTKYPFKVSCAVNTPYVENFDSYYIGDVRNETCWTINKGPNESTWAFHNIDNYYLKNINSSPNVLNIYKNDSVDLFLISPYLSDFNNTKKIKFWLLPFYSTQYTPQKIKIGTISNPQDRNTFEEYTTITIENLPAYGKEFNIDFSGYSGKNKFIAFVFTNENNQTYFYIDDIQYLNNFTCQEPLNITFKNITNNSCIVKWENTITEPVEIEYGLKGFLNGTGTKLTTTTNEIQISNLQESSDYDFYFTTICNPTNTNVVGPKVITTNCLSYSIPWTEQFNNLPSYGINQLPTCMEVNYGSLESLNSPKLLYTSYYSPDQTLNGSGDSSYLYLKNYHPAIVSPSFELLSGVTYKFSVDGRKAYEYRPINLRLHVGRGRSMHYMEVENKMIGQLTEYNYTTNSFYFTPLENGIYTFILQEISDPTDANMILDNFNLTEGYNDSITNNNTYFDFQNGTDSKLILEETQSTKTQIYIDSNNTSNKYLFMGGAENPNQWSIKTNDIWVDNQNNITKVNMKISSSQTNRSGNMYLLFDLKQTFNDSNNESMFRVVINGNVVGNIIKPASNNSDTLQTYQYDLTPYFGSDIRISLQHIGKYNGNTGDKAYLDNIKFSPTPLLSTDENNFTDFVYYPNPTSNVININNRDVITSIELSSLTGQIIHNQKNNSNKFTLDLNNYANGIYFLKVNSNEKSKTVKIIKN